MSISIGQNIASLRARRQLFRSSNELSQVFERLSSGQRINKASDDAAGLAIADSLNANARVFNQGIRNLNDGLSLLNIADQAISTLSRIVERQLELAEQAANGIYTSNQRDALQAEADELAEEYSRILESTNFNDIDLLSSGVDDITLQAGNGDDAALTLSYLESSLEYTGLGTFTNECLSTAAESGAQLSTTPASGLLVTDFNSDGIDDLIVVTARQTCIGISELVVESYAGLESGMGYTVAGSDTLTITGCCQAFSFTCLGAELESFNQIRVTVDDGITKENGLFTIASDGSISGVTSGTAPLVNDLDVVVSGDFNGDGVNDCAGLPSDFKVKFSIQDTITSLTASLEQDNFTLATQSGAQAAIDTFTDNLSTLTSSRGKIGASMARVEVAMNTLSVTAENYDAARSRIQDADMASETARLTRLQILQSASAAVLAQANIQPQLALQLLA